MIKSMLATVSVLGLLAGPALATDNDGYPELSTVKMLRIVQSGVNTRISRFMYIDIMCNNAGLPKIKVTKEPLNGNVDTDVVQDYPGFEDPNPRTKCNEKKFDILGLFYRSDRHFVGDDYFSIVVFYKNGAVNSFDYKVTVK